MKILLVDDHTIVREGLKGLLDVNFNSDVLDAHDLESALAIYRNERPDIVLLDLNLDGAGGLEVLRRILGEDSKARVLIFSMHHEPIYASRAMRSGALGYVSKSAPADELIEGVRKVAAGQTYIDREMASRLAVSQISSEDPLQSLSTREVEIMRLLGEGKSMSAISEHLGIAYKTVANNCTHIKSKLGVERTADLIRMAVENLKV